MSKHRAEVETKDDCMDVKKAMVWCNSFFSSEVWIEGSKMVLQVEEKNGFNYNHCSRIQCGTDVK